MLSLSEAIDTHVHTSPDVVPRAQSDLELAESAAQAGMRGVLLKSHHFSTADRARIAQGCFPKIQVLGGLVLNASSGGLNPEAVKAAFAVGGRVVWLPTMSSQNHHRYAGAERPAIRVSVSPIVDIARDGQLLPQLDAILDLIAEHDRVLATGHLAPDEAVAAINRALERGVRRIVVTHPELPIVGMPIAIQMELAARGVYFERCYFSVLAGVEPRQMVDQIRAVGVASTILATDLGQVGNPAPIDGFRAYGELLIANGITRKEWWEMTRINPAKLLGLN